MNAVDLVLVAFLIMSCFYGYRKGFVNQAIGLLGILISLAFAYTFSQSTAVYLQEQFPLPKDSPNPLIQAVLGMVTLQNMIYSAVAFVLLFLIAKILWNIFGKLVDSLADLPVISYFNRWLGALFGCLQVIIISMIAINLIAAMPGDQWKESIYQSYISQYILEVSPFISKQMNWAPSTPELENPKTNDSLKTL
ncbi:CvpA family protein [Ammoniphilus resinae]|uniref:Membrane protein required for colicin V production n=1 Tax=Ammoniphilus resinae TaxID=861532 RepID=A0ABS4GJL6_9BACL|nr:CvpA family protein [Ammoniphilus resinae]MBP1930342.1 putative membrane protein required for colicin V production [Ammoniphilus resinae]